MCHQAEDNIAFKISPSIQQFVENVSLIVQINVFDLCPKSYSVQSHQLHGTFTCIPEDLVLSPDIELLFFIL